MRQGFWFVQPITLVARACLPGGPPTRAAISLVLCGLRKASGPSPADTASAIAPRHCDVGEYWDIPPAITLPALVHLASLRLCDNTNAVTASIGDNRE
jgi:hypothetical protein